MEVTRLARGGIAERESSKCENPLRPARRERVESETDSVIRLSCPLEPRALKCVSPRDHGKSNELHRSDWLYTQPRAHTSIFQSLELRWSALGLADRSPFLPCAGIGATEPGDRRRRALQQAFTVERR